MTKTLHGKVRGKTIELDVAQGSTIHQLVDAIVTQFPAMRHEMLDEHGQLYSHVHIFVNGRDACYLDKGLDYSLQAEDTLNIFPPVGGG